MTDAERLDAFETRLRESERVAALQGQTVGILVDDAKKHASKETVDRLDDLTRNSLVPRLAVVESHMTDRPDTPPKGPWEALWRPVVDAALAVADFLGMRKRPWLALVYIALGLSVWGVRSVYADFKGEIKTFIVGQFAAKAAADSARSARNIERLDARFDSLGVPDSLASAPAR